MPKLQCYIIYCIFGAAPDTCRSYSVILSTVFLELHRTYAEAQPHWTEQWLRHTNDKKERDCIYIIMLIFLNDVMNHHFVRWGGVDGSESTLLLCLCNRIPIRIMERRKKTSKIDGLFLWTFIQVLG